MFYCNISIKILTSFQSLSTKRLFLHEASKSKEPVRRKKAGKKYRITSLSTINNNRERV